MSDQAPEQTTEQSVDHPLNPFRKRWALSPRAVRILKVTAGCLILLPLTWHILLGLLVGLGVFALLMFGFWLIFGDGPEA